MSMHFYSFARKGYEFIDEVAQELETEDTDKAGRITRSVLRALRNRLTLEESLHFLAQLPMMLKAIYVDSWSMTMNYEKMKHISDFISEVVKEDDASAWKDFSSSDEVQQSIIAVFKVLARHISPGEVENLMEVLPEDLQLVLQVEVRSQS
jgi:uncharacterized protein (DUF2267 family)